jgi:hypothetical protein
LFTALAFALIDCCVAALIDSHISGLINCYDAVLIDYRFAALIDNRLAVMIDCDMCACRYRFIVKPTENQISTRQAVLLSSICLAVSISLSSPLFYYTTLEIKQNLFTDRWLPTVKRSN